VALLERDELLDALDGHLAAALRGEGRLVLVTGEAGVGKSALAQAFAARHEPAVRVLRGACDALFAPGPHAPLADIARTLGGEVLSLLSATPEPYVLFSAVHRALRERPTIVVVEDVHWADDATLDLLTIIGRRLSGTRALVVVTYRHDEVGPEHRLRVALGRLASTGPQRVPALSAAAVSAMAADHAVDAAELYRVTAGNPFDVTECLASGLVEVPLTVADSVLARGLGLSPPARRAWDAAAVLPGAGTPAGLTAREVEVLDLVRAGLSNVEIGQRLYISPRTVDRHMSAVLQQLGVSSRREAARVPIGTPPTASSANTVPR
jgi:DNA-binding NarL/FixJ family response regulator